MGRAAGADLHGRLRPRLRQCGRPRRRRDRPRAARPARRHAARLVDVDRILCAGRSRPRAVALARLDRRPARCGAGRRLSDLALAARQRATKRRAARRSPSSSRRAAAAAPAGSRSSRPTSPASRSPWSPTEEVWLRIDDMPAAGALYQAISRAGGSYQVPLTARQPTIRPAAAGAARAGRRAATSARSARGTAHIRRQPARQRPRRQLQPGAGQRSAAARAAGAPGRAAALIATAGA